MTHIVATHSWAGRREIPCRIIGETPKRYRVELVEPALIGRHQHPAGSVVLVPKHAVTEKRS